MANIIVGSKVIVETGKKITSGLGVVTKIKAATDQIVVELDSGCTVTVDSAEVTLKTTAKKNTTPAKAAPAKRGRPAKVAEKAPAKRGRPAKVEEPTDAEIEKGSIVTFADDDEEQITGEVVALLPNDRAKIKDEDGTIYKVAISDLELADEDAADEETAEDEATDEIVKGSNVSWTDDDGEDLTGVVKSLKNGVAKVETDDAIYEVEVDELTLEEDEPAPAKRGRKPAAAKEVPAKRGRPAKTAEKAAPAKRGRPAKVADESDELTEKGALAHVIAAAEELLSAFVEKPGARTRDKVVNAVSAALSSYAGIA